jgi:effector-binding domain-containing protein
MAYEIKVMELPDQPTLVMRDVVAVENLPGFFGKAFGSVMQYLGELGESPSGMPFGVYYNLDMSALNIAAGFLVGKPIEGKGEILAEIIPGGKFLSTIYEGPYDSMEPVYTALSDYAKEHGLEPTGVAYEYYLNDPGEGPEIIPLTEIRLPLK